jgi:hypothetical protein
MTKDEDALVPTHINIRGQRALYDFKTIAPQWEVTVFAQPFGSKDSQFYVFDKRTFWDPTRARAWTESWGLEDVDEYIPEGEDFVPVGRLSALFRGWMLRM